MDSACNGGSPDVKFEPSFYLTEPAQSAFANVLVDKRAQKQAAWLAKRR